MGFGICHLVCLGRLYLYLCVLSRTSPDVTWNCVRSRVSSMYPVICAGDHTSLVSAQRTQPASYPALHAPPPPPHPHPGWQLARQQLVTALVHRSADGRLGLGIAGGAEYSDRSGMPLGVRIQTVFSPLHRPPPPPSHSAYLRPPRVSDLPGCSTDPLASSSAHDVPRGAAVVCRFGPAPRASCAQATSSGA